MDLRVAVCGVALAALVAGCASKSAVPDEGQATTAASATGGELHRDDFEAGSAAVGGDDQQPEVSREGFEAGITATEIPVPTPTPTPAPGAPAHSIR